MPRALWKGAISFGLVNVPVELFPAEDRKTFKFHLLDKRDFSPVGFKRYSKNSGKEVASEDLVKGYEYAKDQYVVLSDEDFRRANVTATQTIAIHTFVPSTAIPAEYYETPYYLTPGGQASRKIYALLRETLRRTERVGIGQVVIRTTNHLVAIAANGPALMLNTLRYGDEMRTADEFDLPGESVKSAGLSARELELAQRLIDDMAGDWRPEDYSDSYHQDLLARIREKIKNHQTHEVTAPQEESEAAPRSAQVIDLAALLQKSLAATRAKNAKKPMSNQRSARKAPAVRRKRAA